MDTEVVKVEISHLHVRPGDVVVISARFRSLEDKNIFHAQMSDAFPDLRFMVLWPGMEVLAVLSKVEAEAISGQTA